MTEYEITLAMSYVDTVERAKHEIPLPDNY